MITIKDAINVAYKSLIEIHGHLNDVPVEEYAIDSQLIETNLMLLYCVGRCDPYMIPKFTERLSRYCADGYKTLV